MPFENLRKKMTKEHECIFELDFDGQMICYTCFKVDWESTEKFWKDYKSGVLKQ